MDKTSAHSMNTGHAPHNLEAYEQILNSTLTNTHYSISLQDLRSWSDSPTLPMLLSAEFCLSSLPLAESALTMQITQTYRFQGSSTPVGLAFDSGSETIR
jgi:hypothetical protein